MSKLTIHELVCCALFTALTAVLSQFAIPIGSVPINLATLAVLSSGAILGARLGALSQLIYVLLGAAGAPVFAFFSGGIAIILGSSGGYIVGYIAAAWLVGFLVDRFGAKVSVLVPAMVAGAFVYFFLGSCWFMYSTGYDIWRTLTLCVLLFLPGDAAKIVAATSLALRLRPVLQRRIGFIR